VLALVMRKASRYGWWVEVQGCVLAGWITVQILMIREVIWAHYVYLAVALVLILCGWLLKRDAAER
jgi:hypothetical protein